MRIDFRWKVEDGADVDKAAFERALYDGLTSYLSRLIEPPEPLQVEVECRHQSASAVARMPNNEVLVVISFHERDPRQILYEFRGDAPPHKMIFLWEDRLEQDKSFLYTHVREDPFEGWDQICFPSASMVSFECQVAIEIACGLGDLEVANAYLDRALAIGERMLEEELLKRHAPSGGANLTMEEACLDQAMIIARLWRFGKFDAAQAANVISRAADWYLDKGRKDMWPQLLRAHALSFLRFCYVAGDLGTAKLIWSKLKKTPPEQDMSLWLGVEREKSIPARAVLIQRYLDALPRNFRQGGLIMNGLDYQADLAMAVMRLNQVPVEQFRLAPLSTYLRQKPSA